jgi:hypothetical protein
MNDQRSWAWEGVCTQVSFFFQACSSRRDGIEQGKIAMRKLQEEIAAGLDSWLKTVFDLIGNMQ